MKKIVYFGCTLSAYELFKFLIKKKIKISAVFTKKKSYNHDFINLTNIAKKNKIFSTYIKKTNSNSTIEKLKKIKPDYIICIGWPVLLKKNIIDIPKYDVIGFHPTELPKNKGRHPIIWSIILGLKATASSFFLIKDPNKPDNGELISQRRVIIKDNYTSKDLYLKLINVASNQLYEIVKKIYKNKLKIYKKKSSHPGNTWRKRSKGDGKIDWRMSAKSINNLSRALTPPYPYAYFVYKRKEMSVIKTKIILNKNKYFNIEPGRIVLYQGVNPVVKCADGLIKLYVKNKNFKPKKGESLN